MTAYRIDESFRGPVAGRARIPVCDKNMGYIRNRLLPFCLFAFLLISAVFIFAVRATAGSGDPQAKSGNWVVVVPVANMYSSASENTDVVSQAVLGSNVAVLEKKHRWAKVRTADQYTGWMSLRELRKTTQPYGAPGRTVQVESLFANLYRETDVTAHQPVMELPFESHLEVVEGAPGENNRWLEVRLPDERTAWVQTGDIVRDPQPLTIEQSIELGKRFLGIPYLWGGRSSYGYDCSGFTQMLVRSRGINMPRDADLQAAWSGAEAVDRRDLQAGDLLFFGESEGKITHTGMFIGDGEFIHDTTNTHPMVQISRLDDQPWTRLLVSCRRVK
jgi:cell wall-associated NlpC family hydrolase